MQCPYCGNTDIWYGPTRTIHYVRLVLNSPKRYCVSCDKKWMAKHSGRTFSKPIFFGMILIAILSVFLIEEMGKRNYYAGRVSDSSGSGWTIKGSGNNQLTLGSTDTGSLTKIAKSSLFSSSSGKKSMIESLPLNLMGVDQKMLEKAQRRFKEDPNFLKKFSPSQRKRAEEKAKQFATPDAARLIAQALLNLIPR